LVQGRPKHPRPHSLLLKVISTTASVESGD
jgi:hypothetical protein